MKFEIGGTDLFRCQFSLDTGQMLRRLYVVFDVLDLRIQGVVTNEGI